MNSYPVYQNNNISPINSRQNLNYQFNRANQNIDHLRDNFNDNILIYPQIFNYFTTFYTIIIFNFGNLFF